MFGYQEDVRGFMLQPSMLMARCSDRKTGTMYMTVKLKCDIFAGHWSRVVSTRPVPVSGSTRYFYVVHL